MMEGKEKKFVIEIFRKKDPEELTALFSDPEGRLDVGSAAALTGAEACAMALRGAKLAAAKRGEDERTAYLLRNLEKLRAYLVYLIDEDVKGRNIMRRALKEGDPQKIEAARQPACAISDEVICQMIHVVDMLEELCAFAPAECAVYLGSALELALSAIRCARLFVVSVSNAGSDETMAFVVRRENEIRMEELQPKMQKIRTWVEDCIKGAKA